MGECAERNFVGDWLVGMCTRVGEEFSLADATADYKKMVTDLDVAGPLTRAAFMAGLPSDERNAAAAHAWENAMLRAEARAGRQALKQLHTQIADLTAAVKQNTYMYGPEQMVELLTSLGEGTAALVSERSEAIERLELCLELLEGGAGDREADIRYNLGLAYEASELPMPALEQFRVVVSLLPNDVDAAANDGFRALHLAAQNGHVDAIKALLEGKADVDAADVFSQLAVATAGEPADLPLGARLLAAERRRDGPLLEAR
mgnify:CR=1 FL=1